MNATVSSNTRLVMIPSNKHKIRDFIFTEIPRKQFAGKIRGSINDDIKGKNP